MKKILIAVIVLSWFGGLYSAGVFISSGKQQTSEVLILMTILVAVNLSSSRYLYKKADKSKVEWALFGFLGNTTAIFIFWSCKWFRKDVLTSWKRGKRYFS